MTILITYLLLVLKARMAVRHASKFLFELANWVGEGPNGYKVLVFQSLLTVQFRLGQKSFKILCQNLFFFPERSFQDIA